jgi:hypothetical membrane protein
MRKQPRPRYISIMKRLAMAGIIAPIIFTLLVIVQSVLQPDYGQVTQPISALSAWPLGWVQNLNFVVVGSLMIAYAVGLDRAVQRGRAGWIAFALLVASGLGIILAAVFPWRLAGAELVEPPAHGVAAVMTFVGAGVGLIAMSRRMVRDPNWRHLAGYVLACGIAVVVLFFTLGALAIDDAAPLHPWAGLLQRLVLAIWFPCTIAVASRAFRIANQHHDSPVLA